MDDACGDAEQRGQFASEYSAVRMVVEVICRPVPDVVPNVELSEFCSNECRTFEKSSDMTITYDPVESMTVLSRRMIAAVVEPVGRKANWSLNCSAGGGIDSVG